MSETNPLAKPSLLGRTRVLVAGSDTMIGAALVRRLSGDAAYAVVGTGGQPDWSEAGDVDAFVEALRPDYVVVAAGRTAGIVGNQRYPADLMLDNLLVAAHVIPAAWRRGVRTLLYLTSSCTYPREAAQPFTTDALWTGPVEETSAAFATAKLAAMRLCEAYRQQHGANFFSAVAADVFGPGDDFTGGDESHVVPALMSRMHEAGLARSPSVTVWGSGRPRRDFLYVDDLADAVAFLMGRGDAVPLINIGTGAATSILEVARLVRDVVGFDGELVFDTSRPDGAPIKIVDSKPLRVLGWAPRWELRAALEATYGWFRSHTAGR